MKMSDAALEREKDGGCKSGRAGTSLEAKGSCDWGVTVRALRVLANRIDSGHLKGDPETIWAIERGRVVRLGRCQIRQGVALFDGFLSSIILELIFASRL
jgi:hypothetical protein